MMLARLNRRGILKKIHAIRVAGTRTYKHDPPQLSIFSRSLNRMLNDEFSSLDDRYANYTSYSASSLIVTWFVFFGSTAIVAPMFLPLSLFLGCGPIVSAGALLYNVERRYMFYKLRKAQEKLLYSPRTKKEKEMMEEIRLLCKE